MTGIQLPEPQTIPPGKRIKKGQDQAEQHLLYMNCDFEPQLTAGNLRSQTGETRSGMQRGPGVQTIGLVCLSSVRLTHASRRNLTPPGEGALGQGDLRLIQCAECCPRPGWLPGHASGRLPSQLAGLFQRDRVPPRLAYL